MNKKWRVLCCVVVVDQGAILDVHTITIHFEQKTMAMVSVYGSGTAEADKKWWIQPLHTTGRYYTKLSSDRPKQMCRVEEAEQQK